MGRPFQCCLKEYGVKRKVERKIEEGTRTNEAESGDDGERIRHDWVWERRWRMFGCTIV